MHKRVFIEGPELKSEGVSTSFSRNNARYSRLSRRAEVAVRAAKFSFDRLVQLFTK